MLNTHTVYPYDDAHWRRINMRKVTHLAAAESLHNLYNRHWPRINSLRFRNTITNYQNGIVQSYAPIKEWDYLQFWLSRKFVTADKVLVREIKAILHPSYEFIDELIERVDTADFDKLTNQQLALLLIDVMDYPLGEIYKLNVVQIEYSLNRALHEILAEYEPNDVDRNLLLSQIVSPGVLTVAQSEEIEFNKIVELGRKHKISVPSPNSEVYGMIESHTKEFAASHCAYGELPPTVDDYLEKYIQMYLSKEKTLTESDAVKNINKQKNDSSEILKRLNNTNLTQLCELMADIGVFRDKNKAKLGEAVARRFTVLDYIATRANVPRDTLDQYLLAEMVELLNTGTALGNNLIEKRKTQGVTFERKEYLNDGIVDIKSKSINKSEGYSGVCASPGKVEATAKIISSKEDIHKISPGEIMVAIGTDFDLIEIMNISGGIITEEGGLLSHAAVVSRELNKPCLIGVSDATKKFKDGDRIMLDATDGIVRVVT